MQNTRYPAGIGFQGGGEYGRALHRFSASAHRPPAGPPALWSDHARRAPLELPLWGLSARQIAVAKRVSPGVSYRMARVSQVVALTHNLCLTLDPFGIEVHLANLDPDMRGFAVEGVGMGLFTRETAGEDPALLDGFLRRTGGRFSGLAWTGVGLGHVHTGRPLDPALLDRWQGLGRWMVADGLGFWAARTDWERFGVRHEVWPGVDGEVRRIFDRGLGRSAWFENGARIDDLTAWLQLIPEERRRDVALGVGVAATFTGGVEVGELQALRSSLSELAPDLGAGSLNAADTRIGAAIDTAYTARAVRTLSGLTATEARVGADTARAGLTGDSLADLVAWYDRLRATTC